MQVKILPVSRDLQWNLLRILLFGAFLGMLGQFFFYKYHHFFEGDTGWLYQAGQHILKTHQIPSYDIYSWTGSGRRWILYQWLFEASIASLSNLMGLKEVLVIGLVFSSALYLVAPSLQWQSRRIPFIFFLLTGLLCLIASAPGLSLRPNLATLAFLVGQFIGFQYYRAGKIKRAVFYACFFAGYALWSNLHMGFSLGILSLILMLCGDLWKRSDLYRPQLNDPSLDEKSLAPSEYIGLILIALLATSLNPYGWQLWNYLYTLSTQKEVHGLINELNHLDLTESYGRHFLILLSSVGLLAIRARSHFQPSALLHLVVLAGLSLYSGRFLVWFGVFSALILPGAFYQAYRPWRENFTVFKELVAKFQSWKKPWIRCYSLSVLVVLLLPVWLPPQLQPCEKYRPIIKAYLSYARHHHDIRLANDDNLGSCLIFYSPTTKVYIDTRFDMYGAAYFREWHHDLMQAKNWQTLTRQKGINALLISSDWPLITKLNHSGRYQLIYRDPEASFFVRRQASL